MHEREIHCVLLHGFLGSHRNLGALVRQLRARHTNVAFHALDLPGHGNAAPLPSGATLETMAAMVLDAIAALDLGEPLWTIGHSLGGRVALMTKRLAPGALGPIALLDITPSPIRRRSKELRGVAETLLAAPASTPTREEMRELLAQTLTPAITEWLLMNLRRVDQRFEWTIDRSALAKFDRTASDEDLWDTIDDSITCIRGGDSPYVSDEDAHRMTELGARVFTVDGAGHFVHVDATEAVASLLESALGEQRRVEI